MSLKLSRVLPPVSVAVAAGLLQWGRHSRPPVVLDTLWVPTPTLLCYGINAPAFRITEIVDQILSSLRNHLLSDAAHSGDIIFLVIVAMFWYMVGRRMDYSRSTHTSTAPTHLKEIAWEVLVMLYGLTLLIVICLHNVLFTNPAKNSYADNNFLGELVFQALWFIWALILIIVPSRDLFGVIRRRRQAMLVPDSSAIPR
jgi:hypothetical protein